MKLMVASDLHGSTLHVRELVAAFEREGADKLLLLGDLLYHGPRNALPDEYDPAQVIPLLNNLKEQIIAVRGNCDSEVDQAVLDFSITADTAVLYLAGRVAFATHGHRYNPMTPPPMRAGDILINGHTHVPACEHFGHNNLYLNPGSTSIPKGGSWCGYMMIDGNAISWKDFEGRIRKEYQLEAQK